MSLATYFHSIIVKFILSDIEGSQSLHRYTFGQLIKEFLLLFSNAQLENYDIQLYSLPELCNSL